MLKISHQMSLTCLVSAAMIFMHNIVGYLNNFHKITQMKANIYDNSDFAWYSHN